MMSCAGIQESHNFITIQTHGLKAIFEMIATRAYGHQSVNFDTLDLMSSTIWLSCLRFSCGCNNFAASRFDKGLLTVHWWEIRMNTQQSGIMINSHFHSALQNEFFVLSSSFYHSSLCFRVHMSSALIFMIEALFLTLRVISYH